MITWIKFDWKTIVGSISPSKCLVHKIFRVQLIFNTSSHWRECLIRPPPPPTPFSIVSRWFSIPRVDDPPPDDWTLISMLLRFPGSHDSQTGHICLGFHLVGNRRSGPASCRIGPKDPESEEKEDNRRAQFATHLPASFRPSRVIFGHFGASWGDFGTDLTHWFSKSKYQITF